MLAYIWWSHVIAWFSQDGIAVIVIENQKIVMTLTGCDREAASLVCMNETLATFVIPEVNGGKANLMGALVCPLPVTSW